MVIDLRPVRPEDEAFLYDLYRSTRSEEMDQWGMDAAQQEMLLKLQFTGQQQTYLAQFPKADHDIILLDGSAVGRVMVERMENEIRGVDIALLPQYRSAGIGSLVIKNLMAEAEKAGKPFRIQVVKSNRAARLYERLGLSKTGESGTHFEMEYSPNK